ncbi:hypothetical protein M5D96_001901, partial [Drosophila gunungcola]
ISGQVRAKDLNQKGAIDSPAQPGQLFGDGNTGYYKSDLPLANVSSQLKAY